MKIFYVAIPFFLITACSNTTPSKGIAKQGVEKTQSNLLDIRENRKLTEKYWILSSSEAPKYPLSAAIEKQSGCVEVSLIITSEGVPQTIKITKANPKKVFDQSALKSVKSFRWTPTQENEANRPVLTKLSINFSMSKTERNNSCENDLTS